MASKGFGPLRGIRIIEFAGVGPGPFCGMLLADMGAEVVTLDRKAPSGLGIKKETRFNLLGRNRPSVAIDLKAEAGRAVALRMIEGADALIEGYRPGVMERFGLGPDTCLTRNPRLAYGRMTGWGQDGPLAPEVGHDLTYLSLTGCLALIGPRSRPAIPLNLLADLAGGGPYLAMGLLAAILEARTSGQGQVVDAAMIDGIGSLMTHQFSFVDSGQWVPEREANYLDGGAPWYNVYETSDGRYVSVAAIEPKFYAVLVRLMGLDPAALPDQMDRATWPEVKAHFAAVFATKTRDEWCATMDGHEACFAPVLDVYEAMAHPHLSVRGNFIEVDGVRQPAPAPRFSRTPAGVRRGPPVPGADADVVLPNWGFSEAEIAALRADGVIG
jgi:alpha-methylacyl-CoA racemase